MFRLHKTLDVVTLFHKQSTPASLKAFTILKQQAAISSETATEDQASDHASHDQSQRSQFDLNVTEDAPTPDQLRNIFEYVGAGRAADLVKGARDEADAMKKLKESGENFKRPVTVDWNNGQAVVGADESAILKMIHMHHRS